MTTPIERLAQIELDQKKEAALAELKHKYGCPKCVKQGANPIVGKCSTCGGSRIDPSKQKEYDREREEIEAMYSSF